MKPRIYYRNGQWILEYFSGLLLRVCHAEFATLGDAMDVIMNEAKQREAYREAQFNHRLRGLCNEFGISIPITSGEYMGISRAGYAGIGSEKC
jgi:hypothetical protein